MLVDQALWAATVSQLMPNTWAFRSSNPAWCCRNKEACMVQPDVKSNTWNDRTTGFWPLKLLRLISPSLTDGRVKSGAGSPTCAGISQPSPIYISGFAPFVMDATRIIHYFNPCYDTNFAQAGRLPTPDVHSGQGASSDVIYITRHSRASWIRSACMTRGILGRPRREICNPGIWRFAGSL